MMNSRETDLYKLGFTKNEHQFTFYTYKYGHGWYVDFYNVYEPDDEFWNKYLEKLKYDLLEAKRKFYEDVRNSFEYNFAVKENKKQIKDRINALKSKLAEEKTKKTDKRINTEKIKELEIQIEILKSLL